MSEVRWLLTAVPQQASAMLQQILFRASQQQCQRDPLPLLALYTSHPSLVLMYMRPGHGAVIRS